MPILSQTLKCLILAAAVLGAGGCTRSKVVCACEDGCTCGEEKTALPAEKKAPLLADEKADIVISENWAGDLPVAALEKLPADQRDAKVGYIADQETLRAVLAAMQPPVEAPAVDFSRQLVVFVRNTQFYNRTRIGKVTLSGGVAEVVAAETMSAMPIRDRVAISLALIDRAGVKSVSVGQGEVPVPPVK